MKNKTVKKIYRQETESGEVHYFDKKRSNFKNAIEYIQKDELLALLKEEYEKDYVEEFGVRIYGKDDSVIFGYLMGTSEIIDKISAL